MSAPETTTEQAAPDPLDAEGRQRADAWAAERLQATRIEMHRRWGWGDDDVRRGLEKVDYTTARLGITPAQADEAENLLGAENAMEYGAKLADDLAAVPVGTTPDQAEEIRRDLIADRDFGARLAAGDRKALRYWGGICEIAARRSR